MSLGSRSLPAPTADEKRRQDACRKSGCIACFLDGKRSLEPRETHHLKVGNLRAGERFTVCLCAWHHQGHRPAVAKSEIGPSLAKSPRDFHLRYGSDQALLDAQDRRIDHPTALIALERRPGRQQPTGKTGHKRGMNCLPTSKTVPRRGFA